MQDWLASLSIEINKLTVTEFYIAAAVLSAIVIVLFYQMVKHYKYARLLQNVPTAKIRSAPQGYVELIGTTKLMDGPPIISPISGTRCVWFRYTIEEEVTEYEGKGRIKSRWKVIKKYNSDDIFLLDDSSDQCVIDPDDANVITKRKKRWYKQDSFPARRYTEWTILEGDYLYALGHFQTVASIEDSSIKNMMTSILKEWKNDPNNLLHHYDKNGDGQLSQQEWEKARHDAYQLAKAEIGARALEKSLSVLKVSPHKGQPFILSTESEANLIKHNKRIAYACLLAFYAIGVVLVWMINQRIGIA
ncbi:hypothetical protein GCM10007891_11160 [Methylophaga thalassica]|uniref:EF-hand domain-containing protein n=1 Tax=Methylophaga thalassica TaxID=40223 RepID=A0ABQ5TUQ0_9GAMM|nr:hypothetical protein [Methylophaga thalassica]GLP99262.1 hypothetical protein GCM10007891_11160 [Methylophaga thalassica]